MQSSKINDFDLNAKLFESIADKLTQDEIKTLVEYIKNNSDNILSNLNDIDNNTNINNTASSTGVLSQKLSYIINQLASSTNSNQGYTPGCQTFTSSGSFTVPSGVYRIKITACGGGGGGATCSYEDGGGSGGGGGSLICNQIYSVTPGETIPITIGAGGASDRDGGDTIIGTLVTLTGGKKGTLAAGGGKGGTGAGNGGSGRYSSSVATDGGNSVIMGNLVTAINLYQAGAAAIGIGGSRSTDASYPYGGGGGASLGNGGAAGNQGVGKSGTGYGSGGGAGAGFRGAAGSSAGGAGLPGICVIEW